MTDEILRPLIFARWYALRNCRWTNPLKLLPCSHVGCLTCLHLESRPARISPAALLASRLSCRSHLGCSPAPISLAAAALIASRMRPCSLLGCGPARFSGRQARPSSLAGVAGVKLAAIRMRASAAILARRRRRRRARHESPAGKRGRPRSPASSSPPVPADSPAGKCDTATVLARRRRRRRARPESPAGKRGRPCSPASPASSSPRVTSPRRESWVLGCWHAN